MIGVEQPAVVWILTTCCNTFKGTPGVLHGSFSYCFRIKWTGRISAFDFSGTWLSRSRTRTQRIERPRQSEVCIHYRYAGTWAASLLARLEGLFLRWNQRTHLRIWKNLCRQHRERYYCCKSLRRGDKDMMMYASQKSEGKTQSEKQEIWIKPFYHETDTIQRTKWKALVLFSLPVSQNLNQRTLVLELASWSWHIELGMPFSDPLADGQWFSQARSRQSKWNHTRPI